ncbi:MAG: hypothetical protein QF645_01940 [Planctomycetota bacterium]|jgi:hypothetical protein|nr:hypothetical protein [Planctomycetota bacterium]
MNFSLSKDVYDGFWSRFFGIEGLPKPEPDGSNFQFGLDYLPPAWVLALIIVPLAIAIALFFYRGERKDIGTGAKLVLTSLRSILFLMIVFMLFGPHIKAHSIEKKRSVVIVLIDASTSMNKIDTYVSPEDQMRLAQIAGISSDEILSPEEEEKLKRYSRADLLRGALRNEELEIFPRLERKLEVRYFTFSSRPTAYEEDRDLLWEEYRSIGSETAIGEALSRARYLKERPVGEEEENSFTPGKKFIAGIIVFSDFRNNTGIDPERVAQQFRKRYLPVYTVLAGIPQSPRDIELLEPEGNMAILANDEYTLNYKIRSFGFDPMTTAVDLWVQKRKEGDVALPSQREEIEKRIALSQKRAENPTQLSDTGEKQVGSVSFRPKVPGDYLLILKVEPREGESNKKNNYLVHPLRVADDKIKILYVEGRPRYEYRFLKNALIRDTKILCHCLLTSADKDFPQEFSKGSSDPLFQNPIQEFPRTLKELAQYDVVILGDIDPIVIGGEEQWENLETFVTEFGGGLVLISGHSNPRQFMDKTSLRRLVPVQLDPSDRNPRDRIYDRRFGYALTADARGKDDRSPHPIIYYRPFSGRPEKNIEHWEDRDERNDGQIGIRWFLPTKGLAQNATSLVEITGTEEGTRRPPLFVTQYNGRGRVFWSGTDETWLWRYLQGDSPWFYPFWQQAMKWVRQGKLLGAKRYRIDVDKDQYVRGEKVKVYVTAYDVTFRKRTESTLTVFLEPPTGKRIPVELKKSRAGYYSGEVQPEWVGGYEIWAGEEDEKSRAEDRFSVIDPSKEENRPILDETMMKNIANASYQAWQDRRGTGARKMQYYTLDQIQSLPDELMASQHIMRTHPTKRYLWSSIPVWLLFALLITLEWIIRKLCRML